MAITQTHIQICMVDYICVGVYAYNVYMYTCMYIHLRVIEICIRLREVNLFMFMQIISVMGLEPNSY